MKLTKLFVLPVLLSLALTPAVAQKKKEQDSKLAKQFDRTLAGLSKVDISKSAEVKKVAAEPIKDEWIFDESSRLLHEEVERETKEIEAKSKEYQPNPTRTKYLDKDLLPLMADMPEPEANLPLAKKLMKVNVGEDIYSKYVEKLERIREQMAEVARKTIMAEQKSPEQMKQEAYKNAASVEQSMNNNPAIQQMGGLDKLKNMTPEQREAMAKQMSANMKNNPAAYSGAESDPRKAFTNKMMKDPSYAARFNKMNDQQKQEEYKNFIAENGFVNNTSQSNSDKTLADRNKAAIVIALDKRAGTILEHAKELTTIVGGVQQRTDDYFNSVNKKLSDEYAQRVAALPEVEHGEAGKSKDTHPLDIAYQIIRYPINQQHALADKQVWKAKVEMLKAVIADHNDFLAEYWGKDKATDRLMIERGMIPAALVVAMCDQLIDLTKLARFLTNQNAGWQRSYEMMVLQFND